MNPAQFYGNSITSGSSKKRAYEYSDENEDNNPTDFSDSSNEYVPSESSTDCSSSSSSDKGSVQDIQLPSTPQPQQIIPQWKSSFSQKVKVNFIGNSGLQKRIPGVNVCPFDISQQFFDVDILNLMVEETNRYGQQYIATHTLRRSSRMKKWVDTTLFEMKKFLGILLVTGLVQYPNIEDYWRRDTIFYHPMFHQIGMSYNRFSLILKNWHVCDNSAAQPGNRLHKIDAFVKLLLSKIQVVYTPGEEISVDKTMISHRGRLIFCQYNPGKAHKYGIKLFKLCEISGYIWNFSIYCRQGTSTILPGLDHPGSVVVSLAERLLNKGRILVADNWYSSIGLATFLKNRNTEYCGTMRVNRSGIPNEIKTKKLDKGAIVGAINNDGIRIFKYQDKKSIFMVSTFHGPDIKETNRRNRQGEIVRKPTSILDYNRIKGGIDLSDQMISYYSPARKSVKWYRKVLFECISIAVVNSWVLYNKFYSNKTMQLAPFTKCLAESLLGLGEKEKIEKPIRKSHELTSIARKENGKIVRKRCHGCYKRISEEHNRKKALKEAKQISTECVICEKPFCLSCFNKNHET